MDYVEGDFPTIQQPNPSAVPSSSEFGNDDTSDLFQQHFGGFFNSGGNIFNPFGNFGGIGFGPINSYKPWYKG